MKGKFLFATGLAAGYVLGSRSGRAAYDKLKARSAELWHSKPVQDKVAAAAETLKEKPPRSPSSSAKPPAARVLSSAPPFTAMPDTGAPPRPRREQPRPERPCLWPLMSIPTRRSPIRHGQDWSDEGGATPAGPATNVDGDKLP